MNILQAIVLGIIQGATEFIPVSSSGHLVLVPWLFGWPEPGIAFDTILHLGTLLAVVLVFWRDWIKLAAAWLRSLARRESSPDARLAWWILLATLPAAVMGVLLQKQFEALFSKPTYVALFLLVTGAWLILTDRLGRKQRAAEDLTAWQALAIGCAQGIAIAPGISRSGATIGAGLLLGLKRDAAARFSFLLSMPIILGSGLMQVKRLLEASGAGIELIPLAFGFLAAFLIGYTCIRFLLSYLRKNSLAVFAVYCWVVGLGALALSLLR